MSKPENVEPVSEALARKWTRSFLVAPGATRPVLHLSSRPPHPGEETPVADGGEDVEPRPLCGNFPREEYRRKSVDVYPPGYRDICQRCRRQLGKRTE